MKKAFIAIISLACIHLQAAHFRNTITVTAQENNEYLVEMKIETVGDHPEVLAFPALRCVEGTTAELFSGTEASGYLIKANVVHTQDAKEVHTSVNLKQNGQIVDTSEHVIKFVH
jgi:hypothetical protein